MDSLNIVSPSPNGKYAAYFDCSGEIRFGPLYYSLLVDNHSFGQRIFGDAHCWSQSSTFLAVQEWLTLDYSEGPITSLVIIALQQGREAAVARGTKGFVVPETFDDSILVYHTDHAGRTDQHVTLDVMTITEWKALA
jgi:hypothetical protein